MLRRVCTLWAAFAVIAAGAGALASPASAGSSVSSSYTTYATTIRAPHASASETLGQCSLVPQYPGETRAEGAPDGHDWTIDLAQSTCNTSDDQNEVIVEFDAPACSNPDALTGIDLVAWFGPATDPRSGKIVAAAVGGATPTLLGVQTIPAGQSVVTVDLTGAGTHVADALPHLDRLLILLTTKTVDRVYAIDAFGLRLTGDLSSCTIDQDHDGLDNPKEHEIGTNPLKADTDGGGVGDGVEVDRGSDPLNAADDLRWPPATTAPTTTTTVAQLPRTGTSSVPLVVLAFAVFIGGAAIALLTAPRRRGARRRS